MITMREQTKLVLDLLPKLLTMCTSTTYIIDAEIDGGGMSPADYRVEFDIISHYRHDTSIESSSVSGLMSISVPFFHRYENAKLTILL